jgi:CRISPR-associated protein Cas1
MHPIPISERLSILYLERGVLELDGHTIVFEQEDRKMLIPVGITAVLMLGPGVTVTHAAVKLCAEEGAILVWTGEHGVRTYAVGNPRGRPESLLRQAGFRNCPSGHLKVARRIYTQMFDEAPPVRYSVDQIRGLEGSKVKKWYANMAEVAGVEWEGKQTDLSSPVSRALAGCNAALYGVTEATILALGYSPSVGFVHSGNERSFVFDLADTIKFKTVAPLAFELAKKHGSSLTEPTVRHACRDLFFSENIARNLVENLESLFSADGAA